MAPRKVLESVRFALAILVGMPLVVLVMGALYSLSCVRGGHYGTALALALVHGGLLWVVFWIGRPGMLSVGGASVILGIVSFGPFAIGHSIGYSDLESFAYRSVKEDTSGRYPAPWKDLGREALFAKWVGHVTGREGGGIVGYMRAQAAIGWEGTEGRRYRAHVVRTGFWVWVAWICHILFFFAAGALALFGRMTATAPDVARPPDCAKG